MKKLLFITLVLAALLPVELWAQSTTGGDDGSDAVAAPTFRFDGDYLVIETATEDASIFYQMADLPDMSDETIEKVSSSMTVTADIDQSYYYEQPIELKKSVVLKAIAVGSTESEISTLVYDYDSWHGLLEAIEYGEKVEKDAIDNASVEENLKEQLKWAIDESKHFYDERAMMPYQEAQHFTNQIYEICAQIDQQMGGKTIDEPYAVLSENNTVLTFYYDGNKDAYKDAMSVGLDDQAWYAWFGQRESITTVVFDASFANCTSITSIAGWFYGCKNLITITDMKYLVTDNVTNMSWMFYGCSGLMSLDLSRFNTSSVTDMSWMFYGCSGLTSLDLSHFDTTNVTNMEYMFSGCSGLTSLNLSHFDTSSVTNMGEMFADCSSLTSLDLSHFNTSSVTNMSWMFYGCSSLTSLDLSSFDTSSVTDMHSMFSRCSSLTNLDLNNFYTSKVTDMQNMFSYCSGLTSLDLSSFNTSSVKDMHSMFHHCSGLTSLDLSSFNTSKVTNMNDMFADCSSLTSLDLSSFNTSKVTNMGEMFADCSSLTSLDLSIFNTSSVMSMGDLFGGCSSLVTIYGNNWDISKVTNGSVVFGDCTALVGGAGTVYDANHTDYTYAHIDGGPSNPGYFTDKNAPVIAGPEPYAVLSNDNTMLTFYYDDQKTARNGMSVGPFGGNPDYQAWYDQRKNITSVVFDNSFANCTTLTSTAYWFYDCENLTEIKDISNLKTDNVTTMYAMFSRCLSLKSLDLSNFNTANVKNMGSMFEMQDYYYEYGPTTIDISGFNTNKVKNMSKMFKGCSATTNINLGNINTANVTDMSEMFYRCKRLTSIDLSKFKTDKVTDMSYMFSGCRNLTSIDVSMFNTSHVVDIRDMFQDCESLTTIDLSNFNTNNVKTMRGLFDSCTGLTNINLGDIKTDKVTDMSYMFFGCSSMISFDLRKFNTNNVTAMEEMFEYCSSLKILDLSSFNTDKVKNMFRVFKDCPELKTIYVGNEWNTTAVTNGEKTFLNCTNLVGGAGTTYDVNHTDYTYAHIDGGENNPGYFTYKNAPVIAETVPYAVLSENNTVLTFYYDEKKDERNGLSVGPFIFYDLVSWYGQSNNITSVVFDNSFANCTTLTSTAYWFYGCKNLVMITDMENLKTDNVTTMQNMFSYCSSLTNLDLSHFNTSSVTDMSWMFYNCSSLTSLDLSSFDTSGVTNMECMFYRCSGLTSLDVSTFNTSSVTNMSSMFHHCSGLTSLDLNNFNTSKVTDMNDMFTDCSSLTSINLSNFDTSSVTDMGEMFADCSSLTSLDVSHFNTSNVTSLGDMFGGCSSLVTIYGSNWDLSKVVSGSVVFGKCTALVGGAGTTYDANHTDYTYAHIDEGPSNPGYFTDKNAPVIVETEPYAVLSENNTVLTFYYDDQKAARNGMSVGPFDGNPNYQAWYDQRESITSVVFDASFANCITITSTAYWFYGCEKLTTITGISNLKTGNVTDMGCMFEGCSNLTSLDVSHFDTSLVEGMYFMFAKCSKLTNLDLSNFNTSNVKKMHYMFWDCSALQSIALSNFNTSNVIWMHLMFDGCSNLTSLDVSNFDTSNVTEIEAMFDGCYSLTSLDVSHFNTSKAKYLSAMFNDCRKLKSIDVSHFDTSNAESMLQMFAGCYSLTSLDVSNFNTAKVTNMKKMFSGCSNLVDINMSNFNTDNVTDMTDIFANCTSLASIQAGSAMIPASEYAKVVNPNLLVYVNDAQYTPENIQNVVIGDLAKNIVLKDVTEGNGNFYCPKAFKAEMISYTHEYRQQTEIGVARGWETIAMPFTVQTIMHEKQGRIVPFGNSDSGANFWLRQMTSNGLQRATKIEANVPYIISMPNNEAYYAQYNLAGRITFSSQDALVPMTQYSPVHMQVEGGMLMFVPCFQTTQTGNMIYALNVGEARGNYPEGSVFEANYRDVRPFEAFTVHEGNGPAPQFIPVFDLNEAGFTGIEDVRSQMSDGRGDNWYDLNGRRLQGKPAQKGVYIKNGRKQVVK